MRTSSWLLVLALSACGASDPPHDRAEAPPTNDEEAPITEPITEPIAEPDVCPPDPCAGPEPTPEALLARATSIARQRMWQDMGGDGDAPSTPSPTAAWAHAPFAVTDAVADQLGAITVTGVPTTRRPGAAAFLAMHREDGWYACMVVGRAGTHDASEVAIDDPPAATALFEATPRGVTMRVRFTEYWRSAVLEYARWEEHVAVCGVENVPACYGVIQRESGGSESDGEGTDRQYENVELRFDGAGRVVVSPAWGEETVVEGQPSVFDQVGQRTVRNLRCNLRAR